MITCSLKSATFSTYFISAKLGLKSGILERGTAYSPKYLMSSKLANGFWILKGLVPTVWDFAPQQNCFPTYAQQNALHTGKDAGCGIGTGH